MKARYAKVDLEPVAPGVYRDGQRLIFDVPEILKHLGAEDTPENRDICCEAAQQAVSEAYPGVPVEVRE